MQFNSFNNKCGFFSDDATGERGFFVTMVVDEAVSKGNVLSYIQGGTNTRVKKTPIAGNENDMPCAIALEAASGAGQIIKCCVSGICQVLPQTGDTITQGYICTTSGTVAGTCTCSAAAPAAATHFKEIGHCAETVAINTIGKMIIHFN